MSWRSLLLFGAGWVVFCAGVAARGAIVGAIVGVASWAFIAAGRFWLEWGDRFGRIGELRAELERRRA